MLICISLAACSVIATLKGVFVCVCEIGAIPIELHSDISTHFSSLDFADFCKSWSVQHITNSPHYPQSNRAVERAVGTAKHILHQPNPQLALLCYRATPIAPMGASPAQPMLRRQICTTLPILERNLQPHQFSPQQVASKDEKAKAAYKHFFDKINSVCTLPDLNPGDQVLLCWVHTTR